MAPSAVLRNREYTGKTYHSIEAKGPLLDRVFSLRYESYLADNFIDPHPSKKFMDKLDSHRNCKSFITYVNGAVMGSIRSCLYKPNDPITLPVMECFHDEIGEKIGYENTFLEANRFVIQPDYQKKGGILARFNIYKNIVQSALDSKVDCVVAGVRSEHVRFYRHLHFSPICKEISRPYPLLKFNTVLVACWEINKFQEAVWDKLGLNTERMAQ